MTLSRVVVLPVNSMRRTKNCFCWSKRSRQIDDLFVFEHVEVRLRSEIDVSVFTVELFVVVEGLAQLVCRKNVALLQGKDLFEEIGFEEKTLIGISANHVEVAHVVAVALFNFDGDVRALSVLAADPGHGNRNPGRFSSTVFKIGSWTMTRKNPWSW